MNSFRTNQVVTRTLGVSAVAAALALSAGASAQVQGDSYTPAGANYTIYGLQGITSSDPSGQAADVYLNFEQNPSVGVAYNGNNGNLTDFGIGLYQVGPGKTATTDSTGLAIQYSSLVNASSATLTLEDFDLQSNATTFNTQKVEPLISIYGANNALLGTATPTQVFSAFTNVSNANDYTATVNVGTLLNEMGKSSTSAVSKVILSADSTNGEKTMSDPYELKVAGKAQPVPEPASLCVLGVGALLLRRKRAKAKA